MSREIPEDEPLSAEDRAYLEARAEYGKIRRIDELNGVASSAGDEPETEESLTKAIAQAEADLNDMRGRLTQLTLAREQEEARVKDNTVVDGEGGSENRTDDYEDPSWTKARLAAEIEKRNEDRDDDEQISSSGTKAQLIERLRSLDAEAADEDDEDDEDDE